MSVSMVRRNTRWTIAIVLGILLAVANAEESEQQQPEPKKNVTLDWATPVLNAVMCPLTKDAWSCGREQAVRMIDLMLADVELTKQDIKDEADADLADRIANRAFSESDLPEKEKPSAVMTTLDHYISNSILSFMGRKEHDHEHEHEHMKKKKKKPMHHQHEVTEEHHPSEPEHVHHEHVEQHHHHQEHQPVQEQHNAHSEDSDDDDDDDDDDEDDSGELETFVGHMIAGNHQAILHKGKPTHSVHHKKRPIHHNHGRDLGVTRGKKHKKKFKKAIMKLIVLAIILKVKTEFMLKVIATHLQIKFFILAALGLLLNAAKFWIDLKKGHQSPQKVIYYEHAQHQHHYDDHADEGWGGGGGYWKRSLGNDESVDVDAESLGQEERAAMQAYRHSRAAPTAALYAQQLAYGQQRPH